MRTESRTFSRIATCIKAYLRKVDSTEAQPMFHGGGPSTPRPSQQKLQEANVPDALKEYLEAIDKKLDLLVNFLSRDMLKEDFPIQTDVTELSGAGLKLILPDDALQEGDIVEIVLLLSQLPLSLAGAVGVLRRAEKFKGKEVLALEFTRIRQSDREAIVQFVFREQREQIRDTKNDDY